MGNRCSNSTPNFPHSFLVRRREEKRRSPRENSIHQGRNAQTARDAAFLQPRDSRNERERENKASLLHIDADFKRNQIGDSNDKLFLSREPLLMWPSIVTSTTIRVCRAVLEELQRPSNHLLSSPLLSDPQRCRLSSFPIAISKGYAIHNPSLCLILSLSSSFTPRERQPERPEQLWGDAVTTASANSPYIRTLDIRTACQWTIPARQPTNEIEIERKKEKTSGKAWRVCDNPGRRMQKGEGKNQILAQWP